MKPCTREGRLRSRAAHQHHHGLVKQRRKHPGPPEGQTNNAHPATCHPLSAQADNVPEPCNHCAPASCRACRKADAAIHVYRERCRQANPRKLFLKGSPSYLPLAPPCVTRASKRCLAKLFMSACPDTQVHRSSISHTPHTSTRSSDSAASACGHSTAATPSPEWT